MYTGLFHTHSLLRYFILITLIAVIVMALTGSINKRPFGKWDNKVGLYLLIFTHLQFVVGLILYIMNLSQNRGLVVFHSETMSNPGLRYWTVEHAFGMIVAIILITVARITSKRMADDAARHRRLFIYNLMALIIILATIGFGDRGIL